MRRLPEEKVKLRVAIANAKARRSAVDDRDINDGIARAEAELEAKAGLSKR